MYKGANIFSLIFIILFGILASMLIYLSFLKPIYQDEGVFLTIAEGIINGKVPYLDFFDHKTPGIYFLLVPIIALFGKSVVALKTFLLVINLASAYLVYTIANKLKKGTGILASLLFLFTLIFFEGNYLATEPFMIFFMLLSVFLLFKAFGKNKWILFYISGITSGLAILTKQTAIVAVVIFSYFILRDRETRKQIYHYFSGIITPWLFVFGYFLSFGSLKEFINQSVILNITSYPREPILEVLTSISSVFVKTLPVWILFLGYVLVSTSKADTSSPSRWKKIFTLKVKSRTPLGWIEKLLILMIITPIPLLLFRHYPHYWIQIIPFVSIFAGMSLYYIFNTLRLNVLMKIGILTLVILSFFSNLKWYSWMTDNMNVPKSKEQKEAIKYINNLEENKILAENQFTGFNFLTNKDPLNKYLFLTEINESENAEQKTIKDLISNPGTIILWPSDPNYAYAKGLQQYILKNYDSIKEYPNLGMTVYNSK